MHYEHHHLELNKMLHDKMNNLYFFQAFLMFVKSLIGIFVPVYLYKIGYSFIDIFIYAIGISLVYLLFIPISVKIINLIGFKKTIILSLPIYFSHIFVLNYVGGNYLFFHLSWISFGLYLAIYWPSMHSEIAVNGSNKHRGSQMGTLQIITTIFSTIAPFIGGIVLEAKGYYTLLVFASIMISIGFIPLLLIKDIKLNKFDFKFRDYLKLIKNKKYFNSKKAFACEGIESGLSFTIWPVVLFLLLNENFANLGALFTVISIISVIFLLYFKSYLDKNSKDKTLNLSSKIFSFNWFLRSLILSVGGIFVYFIESFAKMSQGALRLSFFSIFYNNAKISNYMEYIILRELYLHSVKIIFMIFLIFIFLFFENSMILWSFVILFGFVFSLGLSYLKEGIL